MQEFVLQQLTFVTCDEKVNNDIGNLSRVSSVALAATAASVNVGDEENLEFEPSPSSSNLSIVNTNVLISQQETPSVLIRQQETSNALLKLVTKDIQINSSITERLSQTQDSQITIVDNPLTQDNELLHNKSGNLNMVENTGKNKNIYR